MGGRGSSSGARGGMGGGIGAPGRGNAPATFVDKTADFAGMGLHDFENAIRAKAQEYIGVFDKGGNLIIAGTSGKSGSVAMPVIPPGYNNADLTVTHNHPSGGTRGLGGTFSPADITQLAQNGFSQMRAVANGKSEHTYIMRTTSASNPVALIGAAAVSNTKIHKAAVAGQKSIVDAMTGKGINVSQKQRSIAYLGSIKNYWKPVAESSGYEYITLKKAPW